MSVWSEQMDSLVRERGAALWGYAAVLAGDDAAQALLATSLTRCFRSRSLPADPRAAERSCRLAMCAEVYRSRDSHEELAPNVETDALGTSRLQADLMSLTAAQRASVLLRLYEDLTVTEIAAVVKDSPQQVREHLLHVIEQWGDRAGSMGLHHDDLDVHTRISLDIVDAGGAR